ncbi:hypothetical protein Kpol_541p24 [Vanderwaltozyma polyspora DSM 70294]|uniref:RFX-type winged-helix domain-containing protein n=1 Tax=Vanderwaltozyma polyspora (strain ATCC 22028 / DSM 70294 / BCRC 21397 / CBS 2163 / NBRC 10782 / NRRL Y-8283 / UCD 57-17) TaxID=436907 RepID=A7TIW9_VANPO|nr:uncharacterized protein Kpol_541p24 [Vanderwaltozyma polyspora DSM 70294]EDO17781.1 hypothetical protein Kpol_541p24 [Vanderwaltozyma polyspora DSM 70294]
MSSGVMNMDSFGNVKDENAINGVNTTGNMFASMVATPIKVSRNESSGLVGSSLMNNRGSLQFSLSNLNVFQNLPRETTRGTDDLTRMKMAILSDIPEEIKWALKKYLAYSNKAPYMISLKDLPDLLPLFKPFITNLKPLIENVDQPLVKFSNEGDNSEVSNTLQLGLTCLLILRNLSQDTDSVQVLVTDNEVKDFILFVLQEYEKFCTYSSTGDNKQIFEHNFSIVNELIHYTLDIMEAISSYMAPAKLDDPFFKTLIKLLNYSKDRYMVISVLRSLSRLLVRSKADEESAADNIDESSLLLVVSFLLIDCDSELVAASLDLLYQYILPGNERISKLLSDISRFNQLATVLPKLLCDNVQLPEYSNVEQFDVNLIKRLRPPAPKEAPQLDEKLFSELLHLEEPYRSTMWLRCCFEPVKESEVTQITLWKSYESKFAQPLRELNGKRLLPAVEFIKNVSNAFSIASAMVITDPTTGKKRFVVKGIQPRYKPLSLFEAEEEHLKRIKKISGEDDKMNDLDLKNGSDNENEIIHEVTQSELPQISFPNNISEISKASATFLCLLSNDTEGSGIRFCQTIKPIVLHKLSDVPPLSSALSEYMDNTKML